MAHKIYDLFRLAEQALPAGSWRRQSVTGCWLWTGSTNSNGYGKFKRGGRALYAHRVAYEAAKGLIPDGLTIDHLCRNRRCCNPDHLEAVTLKENVSRSPNTRKSHCIRGHELSGNNLYIDPKGFWKCRTCKRGYRRRDRMTPHGASLEQVQGGGRGDVAKASAR